MMQKYPQGGEENTYIRMVISYWEMVASIVNRGLIDDELFFESNGEIWVVWDRMRSIVPTWRAAFKNPHLFSNIEDTCKRLEAWREKTRSRLQRGHAKHDVAEARRRFKQADSA